MHATEVEFKLNYQSVQQEISVSVPDAEHKRK